MLKFLLKTIALILILGAGLGVTGWFFLTRSKAHAKSQTYIEIKKGMNVGEISQRLASEGILDSPYLLSTFAKISGRSVRVKAGSYRFPSPISPLQVLAKLEEGEQKFIRFTVIEGWTRWDIARAMQEKLPHLKLANADEAFKLMNDTSLIRDLDAKAQNLEGYLFPDTYSLTPDITAKELVGLMVKRYRKEWTDERAALARSLNRTPREIATMASMIETEAKLVEERPLVASVIYNRLEKNIPLGVDSTIVYASKLAGKWRNDGKVYQSDLDRDSPYNTRKYSGLPPGPISSFGVSCLDAALKPERTDYLYYVRNPDRNDGAHNFYSDAAGFERGVRALREWEANRNANTAPTNY